MSTELSHFQIRVFLVDDQAIVGEQVRRMLAPENDMAFLFCQDPTQALAQAAEFKPTVILQDLVMPDVDGMTMVRFFKANKALREVPLIVLSSKEEPRTKADAFGAGANDYLVKLPDKLELIARIRYHSKGYIALLERNEAYEALKASQEALAKELAQAADYVMSILPQPLAERGIKTEWKFIPSARLGGDSFGYHWVDQDHFAMYLLDVCDHGVGPALLSVSAINVLRSQSLNQVDFRNPCEVMSAMNETFQMEKNNDLYFTLWYGVFNRNDRTVRYASGGHPPALLAEGGTIRELKASGMIVGGMPGISYHMAEAVIPPGATLYIFSDGVYEIALPEGRIWTLEEFAKYLLDTRSNPGEPLFDALRRHAQTLRGEPTLDDDFSIMGILFE